MEKWNTEHIYLPIKGAPVLTIPRLLKNRHSILTASELMDRKIEVANTKDKSLIETYFGLNVLNGNREGIFVLTPMFYSKNGDFKISSINDPHAEDFIMNLEYNANEFGGYTIDGDFSLDSIKGQEFTKADLIEYANKPLGERKAKRNPILLSLADNNQDRLEAFIESNYRIASKQLGHTGKMMTVNMPNPNYDLKNMFGFFWFGGIKEDNANIAATHNLNYKSIVLLKEQSSKLIQKYSK